MEQLPYISPVFASIAAALLPFLAFLAQALLGKRAKSGNIALIAIAGSTVASLFVFANAWNGAEIRQRWEWFAIGESTFHVGILLNNLSVLMQLLVCAIALPVHVYSRAYMKGDPGIHRYWTYLSLFCAAMLGLAASANLLQLYVFWELVGFSSYLLIGFWFTRESAVRANKKAFLVNRIGDIGFLVGLALLFSHFGTLDITELFGEEGIFRTGFWHDGNGQPVAKDSFWLTVAGLGFFLGAMAKSAQFPLHVWLPDAMEGPTAVSSLIHAATMVAAGVFLLCSVFPLFNEAVLLVIAIIGTTTATVAAFFALAQYDIKKILAFSTISQLGFMMVGVGIGAWDAAMFHLATHAFFKCLLFLAAGAVIHEMAHLKARRRAAFDPQDIRQMGGLRWHMPWTCALMVLAALALAGFPLTSGFLSKDGIAIAALEWAFSRNGGWHMTVPIVMVLVSLMTAFYIGRLIFKVFFGEFAQTRTVKTDESDYKFPLREAPAAMLLPMFFLSLGCLFFAFAPDPLEAHGSWLTSGFSTEAVAADLPWAHLAVPLFLTAGALVCWFIAWKWYVKKAYPLRAESRWIQFATRQGYLDAFNHRIFVRGTEKIAQTLYWFDRKVVDGMTKLLAWFARQISVLADWADRCIVDGFVNGVARAAYGIGHLARRTQNGRLQAYLGFAMAAMVLGILYLLIS